MTSIRKLAGALCLACCFSAYSNAQQLTAPDSGITPNLVLPTLSGTGYTPWVGGVYQDSLTCWSWGDPGYCGPNAIVRPGNVINFSYGLTNLYQSQNITGLLPSGGVGLRVDGYNFGFAAKNGNGWDDGRVDYLSAYVHFTNPLGQVIEHRNYDLNYNFNWTNFYFSETFNTAYAVKDLGNVTYGFVGRDNNFWAGPYGPEITNVSFSLRYSADPCSVNVLSSPSCPGYLDTIARLAPVPTAIVTEPVVTTTAEPVAEALAIAAPTITITTTTPAAASPAATTGSPAAAQRSGSGPSLNQILGIVRQEQNRLQAVESSTVQSSIQQSQQAAQEAQQTERQAQATVQNSISQSQANNGNSAAMNSAIQGLTPPAAALADPSAAVNIFSVANAPTIVELAESQPKTQTRRAPADNDVAGGVKLEQIAVVPLGFNLYQNALPDSSQFYASREIYRQQRNVDNARLLRGLTQGSDRLHERMVDLQYPENNNN